MSNFESWLDEYRGARWVRVDFHLHTPGVASFKCPDKLDPTNPQHKKEIVSRYVQKLVEQDIRIVALTDYNGIREEWFDLIRQEAGQYGIVVLPGAELSFEDGKHGLHIGVIFPLDADIESINRAIYTLDNNPSNHILKSDGRHRAIVARGRVEDALAEIRGQFRPVLIVVHPNDSKGLFKTRDAQGAARFLREVSPDAIESLDRTDKQRLTSTGELKEDDFARIASVEFSDPRSLDEIGLKERSDGRKRVTFLKLSETKDLDAIRLALHDPQVRVCMEEAPEPSYTRFLDMEVKGSGFLGGFRLALAPELTVLIGGRGVGKSAVLEVIRYALDLEPYAPTEYREGLVRYALGSGGKVSVRLEQVIDSQVRRTYRIDRIWGEQPRVFELDPEREVELPPRDVLGDRELPLFFGQREIYEVTRNEPQRLRLLDEVIGRTAMEKQRKVRKLEEQLRRNARDILELERGLTEKEETQLRLKEIEHEIELYRREGLVEKLRQATLLTQDEERLIQISEILEEVDNAWQDAVEQIRVSLQRAANRAEQAHSANKAILEKAGEELKTLLTNFEDLFQKGATYLRRSRERLVGLMDRWKEERRPLDEDIQRIKQTLGTQALDPDRLDTLTREQSRLETKMESLQALEKQKEEKHELRKALLKTLRDTRYQVFELRRKQAEELSQQLYARVRVQVKYKGERLEFADRVIALLQGSGVDRRTIEEKLCHAKGKEIDGQDIAQTVRQGMDTLQMEFDLTQARANQVHSWFAQDPSRLFELELFSPDDQVRVFLRINDSEKPLEKLSDGQRATAMLLLLLVQVERLLIVDQPEDDLDNRFIYEDIVRILRDQKGVRQIVAATHNPNIPVLGDAELIVALEASEGKAYALEQGAVDGAEMREAVKRIMEGGEEAFRRRAEKYGWIA